MAAGAMAASRRPPPRAGSSPTPSPTTGRIRSTRPSRSIASPGALRSTRRARGRCRERIDASADRIALRPLSACWRGPVFYSLATRGEGPVGGDAAMLLITCPHCGPRDHVEFTYGGDATRARPDPAAASDAAWVDYVYLRDNPRGPHL